MSYLDALIQGGQSVAARQAPEEERRRGLQAEEIEALEGGLGAGQQEINALATLFADGRYTEAATVAQKMTELSPLHGFGWKALGAALKRTGRSADALIPMQNATVLSPRDDEAYYNLGNNLTDLGRLDEAQTSYRWALQINPCYPEAHYNLGIALNGMGRRVDAEASYRRALLVKPGYDKAHNNLGITLQDMGKLHAAEASYRRAIQIKSYFSEAHYNLGKVLKDLSRLDEAEASYRRALDIKPDYAEAHNNLGNTLLDLGRLDEAEAAYRRALELKSDFAQAQINLGSILYDLGRLDEAEANCRRALEIKPDFAEAGVALLMLTLPLAPKTVSESVLAPSRFDRALTNLTNWLMSFGDQPLDFHEAVSSQHPFYLAYRNGNHVELLSRYGDLGTEGGGVHAPLLLGSSRRRLRLVVVSCHFRRHSVWDINVRGLLVHLDRQQFEVVLYHVGHVEDGETAFARSLADVWRDANTVFNFNGWLDAMAEDQPDVILYPEIGMDPVTLRLANCRLAPLQVASWGHPITTGLPTMDLYFSGELLEPSDADAHYRERLVRLPGTGCCTMPIAVIPEALNELEAELSPRRGTRFVIAQMPFKFDPSDDTLYARIAAAVGDSTFILLRPPRFSWATDLVYFRIAQAFREHGLVPEKHLLVIPWLSRERFCALLDLSDVYLDCPSFSGYTTAWQAVHRGLPVVTLEGQLMRQRLAAGLLRKIGLTATIATSTDQYVQIAAGLATECQDASHRNAQRQAIRSAAPRVDNDVRVVRAFEKTLIDALAAKGSSSATDESPWGVCG